MIYNVYIYKNRFLLIDISSHMHFWMAGPLIFVPITPASIAVFQATEARLHCAVAPHGAINSKAGKG